MLLLRDNISRKLFLFVFIPFIFFILLILSVNNTKAASTIYVNSGGSISSALSSASAGDTIIVRDGTYSPFTINKGGTSSAWITIKSENVWGAKINTNSDIGITFGSSGNYVRVEGFDITGNESGIYSNQTASHLYFANNHFHDLGRICTSSDYGLGGTYVHGVSDVTYDGNVFNNIGRLANDENGCSNSNGYYQNHDHAIYIDGCNSVTVKNNVFYNNKSGWDIHIYSGTDLSSSNLNITNNTFAFPNPWRDGHIILAGNLSNSIISKNIFYQPTTTAITVSSASYSNISITNNFTTASKIIDSTSGFTISSNTTNSDPKFVNPSTFDFHLQANSPAVGLGAYSTVTNSPTPVPTITPTSPATTTPQPTGNTGELSCDGSAGVYLYSNSNFTGSCSRFTSSITSLGSTTVGNDSVSSVNIIGNYTTTLYSDTNYLGTNSVLSQGVSTMTGLSVGNDSVSSLSVSPTGTQLPTPTGTPSGAIQPIGPTGNWNLIFNEEFNGTSLDTSKWSECYPWDCHSGGNGELMVYTADNNIFGNNQLAIKAVKQTTCEGSYCADYGASLIQTSSKFTLTYGFTEGKFQVPYDKGYFPAFWMLSDSAEIDLMEVFGDTTDFSCGVHLGHYTSSWGCNSHGGNTPGSWHTFGVDWEPTYMNFYYDGQLVGSTTDSSKIPTDSMYLILNFAIGANFIPAPDASTVFPAYLRSDYIRAWKKSTSTPTPAPLPGDFNHDGKVDGVDYVYVLINIGKTTTVADLNTVIANLH